MAELKTKLTTQPVGDYLAQVPEKTKQEDCLAIVKLMEEVTHAKAQMWGTAIIGVGDYRYQYESGRSIDWFMMGLSPRKQNISLYILGCKLEYPEVKEIMSRFGKHKTGKGCIYIKTLSDINISVLKELCEMSYQKLKTAPLQ